MTKSLFIGSTKIQLAAIDSTNNYARSLINDKMPIEGTLITARNQLKGKGQRSNLWVTEPDLNITCSYILRPAFLAAKHQFYLSAAVALAVFETIKSHVSSAELRIKWPNDILVGNKKIAGILIENTLKQMNLGISIIGIGLNVNQTEFPSSINATSLLNLEGKMLDLKQVQDELSALLEQNYLKLRSGQLDNILAAFNTALYGIGKELILTINGTSELVKINGAKPSGELELIRSDGTVTLHQHHEISWNL